MFAPFAIAAAIDGGRAALRTVYALAFAASALGQLIVGGRAGLLATFLGAAIVCGTPTEPGDCTLSLGAAATAAALATLLSRRLRFDRYTTVEFALDRFSSGRIVGYREALELVSD